MLCKSLLKYTLHGILYMYMNKRMTLKLCFRKWLSNACLCLIMFHFLLNICGLQFSLAESSCEEFCMFVSRAWNKFALGRSTTVEFNGVISHGGLMPSTFGLRVIKDDTEKT